MIETLVPAVLRHQPTGGAETRALVAVLHGVGSSASAMAPLAEQIAGNVPGAAVIVPDAPDRFDGGERSWQWFSISGVDDTNRSVRIGQALPALRATLDGELERAGLGWDRLALVGFSQGAMMALALASEAEPPAAVAAVAGRLARPIAPTAARRPSVLILHGAADPVVPVACAVRAASALTEAGLSVELKIATGQGHAISSAQAAHILRHLNRWLGDSRRVGRHD